MTQKIAFLYLDNTYSIYHSLPIAIEMNKNNIYQIEIYATLKNKEFIDQLMKYLQLPSIKINVVRPPWHIKLPTILEIKLQFRRWIFWRYSQPLAKFDLIVTTIYNDILLKEYLPSTVKFLFTAHGVANSKYAFDGQINKFDFFFIKGNTEENIRRDLGQLVKDNYAKIGYVKLNLIENKRKSLFPNSNMVYWYNPHWNLKLSSFDKASHDILEYFSANEHLNLIFAPHSYLAMKKIMVKHKFKKFKKFKNIIIDFGSNASVDMTYAINSDFYIGDISSQAIEFVLIKNRPIAFIDSNNIRETAKDSILAWELGEVVKEFNDLKPIIEKPEGYFYKYQAIQNTFINAFFFTTPNLSASKLAENAITKFLLNK